MEGVGVILRFAIIDAEVKGIWDKDEPKDTKAMTNFYWTHIQRCIFGALKVNVKRISAFELSVTADWVCPEVFIFVAFSLYRDKINDVWMRWRK